MRRKLVAASFVLLCAVLIGFVLLMPTREWPRLAAGAFGLVFLTSAAVGALITSSPGSNPIGRILLAIGVLGSFEIFASDYATRALVEDPGSLRWGLPLAWFASWVTVVVFSLFFLLFLLFPSGRLPSLRWRPVMRLGVLAATMATLWAAFRPGPLEAHKDVPNPLGIESFGGILGTVGFWSFVLVGFCSFLSIVSLGLRFRSARAIERQQLKWFLSAGVAVVVVSTLLLPASQLQLPWVSNVFLFISTLSVLAIPVSICVAILRYRLYDIDLIINRTLVYGPLTAVLALSYLTVVAGISSFAGESELGVAAATLAVAALFQPLRRRLQAFIDRRFYRGKYDAAKTLELFSTRLRDEIDIESLTAELLTVIQQTMQPAHASLWLRALEPER